MAEAAESEERRVPAWAARLKPVADPLITIAAWTYYTLGFILFFSPFYLLAYAAGGDREAAFQRLNHRFYRGFFGLVRWITPGLRFRIPEEIRRIQGSVIIANHISYLDPILLISLFPRQKTIVKYTFFRVPIFARVLKISGYLPSTTEGDLDQIMIRQMETMDRFLADGGNLFIFPEGTRSRDGRIGPFNKGAFKIARNCGAPIRMLRIRNTDRLFTPGRFRFHTCIPTTIEIESVGTLERSALEKGRSLSDIMEEARTLLETSGSAASNSPA